jgi:hypothetical protein
MSESLQSFLILLGVLLLVLVMWYLSVLGVRHDAGRRLARGDLKESQRRLWVAVTVGLPLFGFALYLFQRILSRYLTPPPEPGQTPPQVTYAARSGVQAEVRARVGSSGDTFPARETTRVAPETLATHTGSNGAHAAPGSTAPGGPRRPRYELVALEGPYAGRVFSLDTLPLRIGRGPGAALALDRDLNVSRDHAEIFEWNGALRVHDLGSTYGTLINGVPITDQALAPGDHLALGGTVLILRELP